MTMHRRSVLKAMAAFPAVSLAAPAFAQTYPDRPIKLIVPYLAGGATDVGARVVAERMAKGLGQPIVIDNRPGAGVIVGTNAVAKADPDGYTLLMTTLAHPINITLQKKLPYDSIADFEPVALMGIINFILVVHPSSPITDLPSLVEIPDGESRQGELWLRRKRKPDASGSGTVQIADRRAGQSRALSRRGGGAE